MKNILAFLCCLFCMHLALGQSFVGYETDNFNGIHGVVVNPASITSQKNRAEFNLMSMGGTLGSDFAKIDIFDFLNFFSGNYEVNGLSNTSPNATNSYSNREIIGPSYVGGYFSKDNDKLNFGAFTKLRKVSNYRNIDGNLFAGLVDEFPQNDFVVNQENYEGLTHAWGEIGLSLGYIKDAYAGMNSTQNFRFGVSVKYLRGLQVELDSSQNITAAYTAFDDQLLVDGDLNRIQLDNRLESIQNILDKPIGSGFGVDIGFIYERETSSSTDQTVNDDSRAYVDYKYKIGLSVLDIGQISYKDRIFRNYSLNGSLVASGIENTTNLAQALNSINTNEEENPGGDLILSLPTRARLEFDLKVKPNFFVNFVGNMSLVKRENMFNTFVQNTGTLSVRYETRMLSIYLPVTYSDFGRLEGVDVGLGVNVAGIFHIGSGTILSGFVPYEKANANTANLFFGVKIPYSWEKYYNKGGKR